MTRTESQRRYINRHKEKLKKYGKDYMYNRRIISRERMLFYKTQRGLKCEICGYNKNWASLVWHHKDPSIKEMQISIYIKNTRNWVKVEEEIKKCVLLCHNCHTETHYPHANIKIGGYK